ncbi:MAG: FHIPEP family type III secretion protein, partial [Candidatus Delongbacteria bacterium]|nr:FHIPEP family type III secretion protein [Candidatus Delongbacteria bacterium]
NVIGGFIIGILTQNLSFMDSLQTYTLLTVGDGLVTQIPSLMVSTASGIIVTRAASESNLGRDIVNQLTLQPRAIVIASILLLFLAIIPGMPTIPFLSLSLFIGSVGYVSIKAAQEKARTERIQQETRPPEPPERIEDLLKVDPMEIEIGYALIPLVDSSQGGDLLERIAQIRKQLATELGIIVPPIRIRDNIQLEPEQYRIKIRGIQIAKGQLMPDSLLAMAPSSIEEDVPGIKTTEPAFGLPATWIDKNRKEYAEMLGYTVVEASAVLATHISEIIKTNSSTILNRQQVKELLDNLKKENTSLVDDLIPTMLSVGTIQKIMQNLLREQIPVRDLETILECLSDYAVLTKDVDLLTEYVRTALNRTITHQYRSENNEIKVLTVDPKLEKSMMDIIKNPNFNGRVVLSPPVYSKLQQDLSRKIKQMLDAGYQPIIVCSPAIRLHFRRLIEELFPSVIILSYNEITTGTSIISVGMVSGG